VICFVTWLWAWLPSSFANNSAAKITLQLLNLPEAIVSLFLPPNWGALDLVFSQNPPSLIATEQLLFLHIRVALPTYLLLFYSPSIIRKLFNLIQSMRKAKEKPSQAK
jgi:hypothetical protein